MSQAFGGCTKELNAKRVRTWTSFDLLEAATTGGLLAAGLWDFLEVWGSVLWVRIAVLLLWPFSDRS